MTLPNIILWPPALEHIFRAQDANQILLEYGRQLREIGANAFCFHEQHSDAAVRWAADFVLHRGFVIVYVEAGVDAKNAGAEGMVMRTPPYDMELMHTGCKEWRPDAVCPGYRGPRYKVWIDRIKRCVELLQPDFIVCDSERWHGSTWMNVKHPGLIAACQRCGSDEKYIRNLRGIAYDIMEACGPRPVVFWGSGNCWPYDVGFAPSPELYYWHKRCERPNEPYAGNPLGRLDHEWLCGGYPDYDEFGLPPPRQSYPWLSIYRDGMNGPLHTPAMIYNAAAILGRRGDFGFGLWRAPMGILQSASGAQLITAEEEEARWTLAAAAMKGFKDGKA